MEQEIATQVVGLGGANDFSLWQLFLRADFVVKAVILLLIASSIFSWTLIFDKARLFRRIDLTTKSFEDKFWKSKSAEAFYKMPRLILTSKTYPQKILYFDLFF